MGRESSARRKGRAAPGAARSETPALEVLHRGIVCTYGPEALFATGPLLPATWSVPFVLREALAAAALPLPEPVSGALLIDSGASVTCISAGAAEALALQPTRVSRSYGAAGIHVNAVYLVRLEIVVLDGSSGHGTTVAWEQEARAIPDLDHIGVDGINAGLVGLLGRDVLRHSRFSYDGIEGTVDITFDIDALQKTPSR
jgi:hypothetical protein